MSSVRVVVVGGLAALAAALLLTLLGSPLTVAASNTRAYLTFFLTRHSVHLCQAGESVPARTSAMRLSVFALSGPRVVVHAFEHGAAIASGEKASGWTGGVVTVPVKPLRQARAGVTVCIDLHANGDETISLVGELSDRKHAARSDRGVFPGRVQIEYLRPGRSSWLSLAPEVARRMGLGHAGSGTWGVLFVIALMAVVIGLSSRATIRDLR
jgi:hypothetical protein